MAVGPFRGLAYVAIGLALSGCAAAVFYDNVTADRVASLGSEVLALYDAFAQEAIDERRVEMIHARLRAIYDYETSKGVKNKHTIRRVEALQVLFERHVADRKAGKWSKTASENYKMQLGEIILELLRLEDRKPRGP